MPATLRVMFRGIRYTRMWLDEFLLPLKILNNIL